MARELSPYVEIERSAWADLADDVPQPLTEDDVQRLKGLGEELDIDEGLEDGDLWADFGEAVAVWPARMQVGR